MGARVLIVLVCAAAACGGSDDPTTPAEDNIVELVLDDDGAERGVGTSNADGVVKFYSPRHQAMFALDLGDRHEAAVAGMEIQVEAKEDTVSYLAIDPSGRHMPMLFTSHVPTRLDEELVVDSVAAVQSASALRGEPTRIGRGGSARPLVVGLLVSINIRAVVIAVGEAMLIGFLGDLVTDTCTYFAPLHEDTCSIVGEVGEFVASIATGGLQAALKNGWNWSAALREAAWDKGWEKIRNLGCRAGKWVMVTYVMPPAMDAGPKPVQLRYRQAAYNYRALVDKLDEMPPADPAKHAKLKAQLVAAGKALAQLAPKVRTHYYDLYNAEATAEEFWTSFGFATAAESIKKLVEIRPELFESLTLGYAYDELLIVTDTSIKYQRIDYTFGRLDTSIGEKLEIPDKLEWGLDCAMTLAEEAAIEWMNDTGLQQGQIHIETALGHMVDMADMFLIDLHREIYGGDIPPPTCLPDIWEPNDTWQAALASPVFAATLGSGVVEVEDLNACDGTGAGNDEDWFKMEAQPINFNVEARIRAVPGGSGQDQRLCLQLYWYSQVNELAMAPPDLLPGGACGTVSSEFSTGQVNVRQATGESYRYILVRVYPDPNAPPSPAGIDYKLTFTH